MTQFTAPGIGLERIQREAFLVLFRNLNTEIGIIETAWAQLDEDLSTEIGEPYVPIELEAIEDANFHKGHRPSLIEAPISRYPNISVMAYQAAPKGADDGDQYSTYMDRMFVEIMVKSPFFNPEDEDRIQMAETVVNSRIQRTTEAVNNVILMNQTLNGIVSGPDRSPTVIISDVFLRQEETSYGDQWLWQGSRLEYELTKAAMHNPPQNNSQQRSISFADIDQA